MELTQPPVRENVHGMSRIAICPAGFAVALTLLIGAPPVAGAQEESPAEATHARALFDEAAQHHQDGRYALAAASFQQAYDLLAELQHPRAPLILFNLGASLAEVPGRECEAKAAYTRFLQEADASDEQVQENLRVVQQRIRELDARVGDCSSSSASADDTQPDGGQGERSSGGISPVGPIIIGVGGALLIGAAVTGGLTLAENSTFESECPDRAECPVSAAGSLDSARTLALVTDVLWIGGAVVAAAGLVLTLTLTESEDHAVTARCGFGGCGLSATGRF